MFLQGADLLYQNASTVNAIEQGKMLCILGAGADVSLGLPTMNGLAKKLNIFAKGAGKPIHLALREKVKNLRFNLDKLGADTAEQLAELVLGSDNSLVEGIKAALRNVDTSAVPSVGAMLRTLDKLEEIRLANTLDEETASGLAEFAGEPEESASQCLLNPRKMVFDATPRQALLRACREAINDSAKLSPVQREAVEALFSALATFEDLLGALFLGYFNNDRTLQKKYFYLAWLFWSYIYCCEKDGQNRYDDSCYPLITELGASRVLTFNYTGFLRRASSDAPIYFHGDGGQFMSFHNRQMIAVPDVLKGNDPVAAIARYIESDMHVDWTARVTEVVLPAIVPPLTMKPLIASEYVDIWYEASQAISECDYIVVVGYSFSFADEHFNDLVRKKAPNKPIIIFDPNYFEVASNVCRVTGRDFDLLDPAYVSGMECLVGKRIAAGKSYAEAISSANVSDLLNACLSK